VSDKEVGLEVRDLTIADGSRRVVEGWNLRVPRGAVHVILGERDTGKTALLEAMAGRRKVDHGEVRPTDHAVLVPHALVPTQLRLFERLLLHKQPRYLGIGIHWKRAREEARALAARVGLESLLLTPVESLRPLERRLLEVAAAVGESPSALFLDEPTSDLGPDEARQFLAVLRSLAERENIPVVLSSSWPRDAYPDASSVTILWRGTEPVTLNTADTSEAALVERWTGGIGIRRTPSGPHTPGDALLRAEGLVLQGRGRETSLAGLDFEVKAGEVLAIVGAPADGLNLLHDILLGRRFAERGTIQFLGKETTRAPRRHRVESGVGFVNPPHTRDQSIGEFSIEENLILGQTQGPPFARGGFLRHDSIRGNAVRTLRDFEIAEAQPQERFGKLKLGDRQRVIVAREVIRNPVLLIVRSPAQGLALSAQEYVRRTLILQCERGSGVLWLTDEPEEAMRVADRLAVLAAGRFVWLPVTETLTREAIVDEMSGAAA